MNLTYVFIMSVMLSPFNKIRPVRQQNKIQQGIQIAVVQKMDDDILHHMHKCNWPTKNHNAEGTDCGERLLLHRYKTDSRRDYSLYL